MFVDDKKICNDNNNHKCILVYQVKGKNGPTGPTGSVQSPPYNLYVQSSASPGGDGSIISPFRTIDEALSMVLPNGTVNVLPGVYPVMSQLNLNVEGLTIKGNPGSMIVLEGNIIPILCNANYITIDGLTITSNIPYPVEFIQVAGDYNQIVNCEIINQEIYLLGW